MEEKDWPIKICEKWYDNLKTLISAVLYIALPESHPMYVHSRKSEPLS